MKKKKENILGEATLETKAVAWNGDIPLKYQSVLEYQVSSKRAIRLVGDPASTKGAAMDNLYNELTLWKDALAKFDKVLMEQDA
jgi:hypothetical protein